MNKTDERLCPSGVNVLKGGEGQCLNEWIMHQGIRRALKGNKALGDDIENELYGEKEEQVPGGGNSRGCEEARGAGAGRVRGSDPEPERQTSSRALLGTRPAGQSTRALMRATSTTGKRLPQTHVLKHKAGRPQGRPHSAVWLQLQEGTRCLSPLPCGVSLLPWT